MHFISTSAQVQSCHAGGEKFDEELLPHSDSSLLASHNLTSNVTHKTESSNSGHTCRSPKFTRSDANGA